MSEIFEAAMKATIVTAVVLVIVFVSYYCGKMDARKELTPSVQIDTVTVRDTIRVDSPVPASELPAGYELVPLWTLREMRARLAFLEGSVPDTVRVEIPIPITRKTYAGEDYHAVVSGYLPTLESISVFPKTTTITATQTVTVPSPYPWTVSPFVSADIGVETFAARAGVIWDHRLRGDWRVFLGGGYEVRNDVSFRTGWWASGGVSFQFHP